jgi:YVTN family beta-propeller protein
MNDYTLLVLHKLEHSFGYYDVNTSHQLSCIKTREFPHEICLSPDRKKVYIAEMGVRGIESEGEGGHTIAVFDLKSRKQVSSIDTAPYDRPHGVATHGDHLYVTSESTKHLLVFDLESEALITAVPLDQECAHMVCVSPDGSTAYTANIWSNSITAVDTKTFEVVRHIAVPERPEGMAFSPDGKLIYCVCREAKSVAVVDCALGTMVDRIETGHGPVRVVIAPDGKHLAIPLFHSAAVEVADTGSRKVTHTIPVGPHPAGTCMSPDGQLVFMSCEDENLVYVFDMETMEVVHKIKTGDGADAMVCLLTSELE